MLNKDISSDGDSTCSSFSAYPGVTQKPRKLAIRTRQNSFGNPRRFNDKIAMQQMRQAEHEKQVQDIRAEVSASIQSLVISRAVSQQQQHRPMPTSSSMLSPVVPFEQNGAHQATYRNLAPAYFSPQLHQQPSSSFAQQAYSMDAAFMWPQPTNSQPSAMTSSPSWMAQDSSTMSGIPSAQLQKKQCRQQQHKFQFQQQTSPMLPEPTSSPCLTTQTNAAPQNLHDTYYRRHSHSPTAMERSNAQRRTGDPASYMLVRRRSLDECHAQQVNGGLVYGTQNAPAMNPSHHMLPLAEKGPSHHSSPRNHVYGTRQPRRFTTGNCHLHAHSSDDIDNLLAVLLAKKPDVNTANNNPQLQSQPHPQQQCSVPSVPMTQEFSFESPTDFTMAQIPVFSAITSPMGTDGTSQITPTSMDSTFILDETELNSLDSSSFLAGLSLEDVVALSEQYLAESAAASC